LVPAAASPLAHLFPNVLSLYDEPLFVQGLLALGALAAIPLALGRFDRAAALLLWYLWACLLGRNPLISNPSLPFIGWMLLAHVLIPPAPYGSWAARGRVDSRGRWAMPRPVFLAAWIVMALGYTYGGVTKLVSPSWADGTALSHVLANPLARPGPLREGLLAVPPLLMRLATWSALALELLFAPLALSRRLRPWIWLAMVGMHLGLLVLVDFADLTCGMLLVHLFTVDPAWIRARDPEVPEVLFYDGHCALCHGAVRFVLAEDRSDRSFRFAPLQGKLFKERVPEAVRTALPDSLVVLTADGALLTRSAAVVHILFRMGGLWRVLAGIVRVVPAPLRDAAYDGIAQIRYRVFGKRDDACPIVPASSRSRFDLR
jgi:predicted DCC family thiol-disulfide oxidoreductase YuxK